MEIKDNSQDKKYFTIIPNYIANHSTANDQALYFQMKRLSGEEEGICFASEKYLKNKLGLGSKALKKSLNYLLKRGWIEQAGLREVMTKGGVQQIKTYIVKDIWKMNTDHFNKGVFEREPLSESKGVSKSNQRGVQKERKGVASEQQRRTYKNNKKKNTLSYNKKKPYFRGMEMRQTKKDGKWWVINKDGDWLEFIGKEKDIIWK
jgi:hypothetical protein